MLLFPEIKQYQFIQVGKTNYIFKLNPDGNFTRNRISLMNLRPSLAMMLI